MKKGMVSIVTPAYNSAKYMDNYFKPFLNQTYKNFEIIYVNDGSTDNTEVKIQEYIEKFRNMNINLKYIKQENKGQASATNTGLKEIEGEFLYWMDADDYCENDTLENLVNFLNNHLDYNIVHGDARYFKDNKFLKINKLDFNTEDLFEEYLLIKRHKKSKSIHFAGIFMIRMSLFDKVVKNRDIYISKGGQNWQLLLPCLYNQKCGYVNKIVYNYNLIESSHSHKKRNYAESIQKENDLENIAIEVLKTIPIEERYRDSLVKKIRKKYKNTRRIIKFKYSKIGKILKKIKHLGD